MQQKNLKQINKELDGVLRTANVNLDEVPTSAAGGWATAIREAKERADQLIDEYQKVLNANSVAIFVSGSPHKVSEFQSLVKDNGGFCIDATSLYRRMTEAILPTFAEQELAKGATWGVAQISRLGGLLREVMGELKIKELDAPTRDAATVMRNGDDILAYIKKSIESTSTGKGFNRAYMLQDLYRQTRANRYTGNTAPVFIINSDDKAYLSETYGKGTASINIADTDELNKDYLTEILKNITTQIKSK